MALVIRTGFKSITHSIQFNPQGIKKGKNLALTHVKRVEELRGFDNLSLIKCCVIRTTSTTLVPYDVKPQVNDKRQVISVSCTCVSQAGKKCKHIYALIHYINTDLSSTKTSYEAEWGKPSSRQLGKEEFSKPMFVNDHFKPKYPPRHDVPVYNLQFSDVSSFENPLKQILLKQSESAIETAANKFVNELLQLAIKKIRDLNCEVCALNLLNSSRDNILYSSHVNIQKDELNEYYRRRIELTDDEIVRMCIRTQDQNESTDWFEARRLRISASSKAHSIKGRTKKDAAALARDFLNSTQIKKNIPALEYGTRHESKAISEYALRYDVDVMRIGLFIMPTQAWLCGSVDGLVVEDSQITKVLEIKCPATCSNKPVFDENTNSFNVPYLMLHDKKTCVKKGHVYYTQCQVLMYVTGLSMCDLYVWSPKGSCLVEVFRDEEFLSNVIPKLSDFFYSLSKRVA